MVLRDVSTIDVNYVKKLYREAFPLRERIPFSKLLKLQKDGIIRILAAYENGEPLRLGRHLHGEQVRAFDVPCRRREQARPRFGLEDNARSVRHFPAPQFTARNREARREQAHDRAPKGILSSLRSARCGCRYIIGRSSNGNSYDRRRRVRQIRIYRHLS